MLDEKHNFDQLIDTLLNLLSLLNFNWYFVDKQEVSREMKFIT